MNNEPLKKLQEQNKNISVFVQKSLNPLKNEMNKIAKQIEQFKDMNGNITLPNTPINDALFVNEDILAQITPFIEGKEALKTLKSIDKQLKKIK